MEQGRDWDCQDIVELYISHAIRYNLFVRIRDLHVQNFRGIVSVQSKLIKLGELGLPGGQAHALFEPLADSYVFDYPLIT